MAGKKHNYSICDKCETEHYTDCCNCFGFGLYKVFKDNIPMPLLPAIAKEVRDKKYKLLFLIKCPQCGSTHKGVPY